MKKDWKVLSTAKLLEEVDKEKNDDDFMEILGEIYERTPFNSIEEKFGELEKSIKELTEENTKIKNQMRHHAHLNGKTVIEI